ncbi:unnamed protein product, partial [Porites lobata]
TLLKLYKAFILPHFYYCSSVWHFCGARNADKKALHALFSSRKHTNFSKLKPS